MRKYLLGILITLALAAPALGDEVVPKEQAEGAWDQLMNDPESAAFDIAAGCIWAVKQVHGPEVPMNLVLQYCNCTAAKIGEAYINMGKEKAIETMQDAEARDKLSYNSGVECSKEMTGGN